MVRSFLVLSSRASRTISGSVYLVTTPPKCIWNQKSRTVCPSNENEIATASLSKVAFFYNLTLTFLLLQNYILYVLQFLLMKPSVVFNRTEKHVSWWMQDLYYTETRENQLSVALHSRCLVVIWNVSIMRTPKGIRTLLGRQAVSVTFSNLFHTSSVDLISRLLGVLNCFCKSITTKSFP